MVPILCDRLHRFCGGGSAVVWWLVLDVIRGSKVFHSSMKFCRSLNVGAGVVLEGLEAVDERACFAAVRSMVEMVWRSLSNVSPHGFVKLNGVFSVWCLMREAMSRSLCSVALSESGCRDAASDIVSFVWLVLGSRPRNVRASTSRFQTFLAAFHSFFAVVISSCVSG